MTKDQRSLKTGHGLARTDCCSDLGAPASVEPSGATNQNAPSHRQVTIKPGGPQATPVSLAVDHEVPSFGPLGSVA
jgi:hypothetical protein